MCKAHSGLNQMILDVKEEQGKQAIEISHIRNRPPVWCTFVIAGLSAGLSSVLTMVVS